MRLKDQHRRSFANHPSHLGPRRYDLPRIGSFHPLDGQCELLHGLPDWTGRILTLQRSTMLSNLRRTGIAVLLSGMLGACVKTQFLPTTNATYELWSGPVEILQDAPADRAYVEVGWLSGYTHSDWGTAIKAMQKEAAERGANAKSWS